MEKITPFYEILKINLQKSVDVCGYELPTNLRNFMQKDSTEVKIFLKVLGGGYSFGTPCTCTTSTFKLDLQLIPTTHLPSLSPTVANVGNINVLKRFC